MIILLCLFYATNTDQLTALRGGKSAFRGCDNALEEWNGFEQKSTDIDECARNRFQYFLKKIPRINSIS